MAPPRGDHCCMLLTRRCCLLATLVNIALLYLYLDVLEPRYERFLLRRQAAHDPTAHHSAASTDAEAQAAYMRQHGGAAADHGDANEVARAAVSRRPVPFLALVQQIVASDREHHSNPMSRLARACTHRGARRRRRGRGLVGNTTASTGSDQNSSSTTTVSSNSSKVDNAEAVAACVRRRVAALRGGAAPPALVPPPMLLAFTLNGTVPLLYEYRDDHDVRVAVDADGQPISRSKKTQQQQQRSVATPTSSSSSDSSKMNATTSERGALDDRGNSGMGSGGESQGEEDSGMEGSGSLRVEGRDYVLGRRYYTLDALERALRLQETLRKLMPKQQQRPIGGGGSNGGSATDLALAAAALKKGAVPESQRANLAVLALFFAVVERLAMTTDGRDVAVFGSLEAPTLEVALLSIGRARSVTSVDYRPVHSDDARITGYDPYTFWGHLQKQWATDGTSGAAARDGASPDATADTTAAIPTTDPNRSASEGVAGTSQANATSSNAPRSKGSSGRAVSFVAAGPPPGRFDLVVAFDAIQHDGLGRFGDPVDPFGDVHAMSELWSLLPLGGTLVLGVPVGNDCLVFNQHRVYGRRRLPLLLHGWEVVHTYGLEDREVDELYVRRAGEKSDQHTKKDSRLGVLLGLQEGQPQQPQPFMGSSVGGVGDGRVGRRKRRVDRFADGQCRGDLASSAIFVLRKVSAAEAGRQRWASLQRVPGLLGPFPLYHRPR